MIVYLCGALATALAAIGGGIRLSGPRTDPITRVGAAVLAGALWPVVAIGAIQAIGFALFVKCMRTVAKWMRTASAAKAPAAKAPADADAASVRMELLLTG